MKGFAAPLDLVRGAKGLEKGQLELGDAQGRLAGRGVSVDAAKAKIETGGKENIFKGRSCRCGRTYVCAKQKA